MMKEIVIQTNDGPLTVEADVFGAWAVHRERNTKAHWSITNIATGRCISPFHTENMAKETAVATAKILDKKIGAKEITVRCGKQIATICMDTLRTMQAQKPIRERRRAK